MMTCIRLCPHASETQKGPCQVLLHCLQGRYTSEVSVLRSVVGVWCTIPGICFRTLRSAAPPNFFRSSEHTALCAPSKIPRVGLRARLTAKLSSVTGQTFACIRTSNIRCRVTQHIVGKCTLIGRLCQQSCVQSCLL
jgi:hypothetical protein